MTKPSGCSMTGNTKVPGQCDAKACNYPFCEASERERASTDQIRLGHERNADRDRGWYQ